MEINEPLCPYCCGRGRIRPKRYNNMSVRLTLMYEAVLAKGADGLSIEQFKKTFFDRGVSPITIRTSINKVNARIAPDRVISRQHVLYLVPSSNMKVD